MKLRTAIKIMRVVEEPWRWHPSRRLPRYKRHQILEAWKICERKWRDGRVPYLPDEQELEMRGEIFTQLLLGGPLFGKGILEGLVPDDVLNEARAELQKLDRERYDDDVAVVGPQEAELDHQVPVDPDLPQVGGKGNSDG